MTATAAAAAVDQSGAVDGLRREKAALAEALDQVQRSNEARLSELQSHCDRMAAEKSGVEEALRGKCDEVEATAAKLEQARE